MKKKVKANCLMGNIVSYSEVSSKTQAQHISYVDVRVRTSPSQLANLLQSLEKHRLRRRRVKITILRS